MWTLLCTHHATGLGHRAQKRLCRSHALSSESSYDQGQTLTERTQKPNRRTKNRVSFQARIILPLLPSPFLAPFICVLCVRLTGFKQLVVFCEPHIIFLMHFNFIQYRAVFFPTITFFYYFAVPHGVPTEEAVVCKIIYRKNFGIMDPY